MCSSGKHFGWSKPSSGRFRAIAAVKSAFGRAGKPPCRTPRPNRNTKGARWHSLATSGRLVPAIAGGGVVDERTP